MQALMNIIAEEMRQKAAALDESDKAGILAVDADHRKTRDLSTSNSDATADTPVLSTDSHTAEGTAGHPEAQASGVSSNDGAQQKTPSQTGKKTAQRGVVDAIQRLLDGAPLQLSSVQAFLEALQSAASQGGAAAANESAAKHNSPDPDQLERLRSGALAEDVRICFRPSVCAYAAYRPSNLVDRPPASSMNNDKHQEADFPPNPNPLQVWAPTALGHLLHSWGQLSHHSI
jgi:hypothetical protein